MRCEKIAEISVTNDEDVVFARQKVRLLAQELGISMLDQTRLITAVSELARNIIIHAKSGTVLVSRIHDTNRVGVQVIFRDERLSGDAYFIRQQESFAFICLIDVLGHGPGAWEVAQQTLAVLETCFDADLLTITQTCHRELRHSRGAAAAFCRLDFKDGILRHVGIGNVETRIYGTSQVSRPFCFNGTLGLCSEQLRVLEYTFTQGATLVMFTDGVSNRFDLDRSILGRPATDIAAFVFENHARDHDDATVLVGRWMRSTRTFKYDTTLGPECLKKHRCFQLLCLHLGRILTLV